MACRSTRTGNLKPRDESRQARPYSLENAVLRALLQLISFAAALAVLSGCTSDPPLPPTYKVEGRVVNADGKPFTGGEGLIEFRVPGSQDGSFGRIGADGSFTLKTVVGARSVEGAPEGEHIVRVTLGDPKNPQGMELKTRYAVRAGEVNKIEVKLEQ